jgi:hypothetical protein
MTPSKITPPAPSRHGKWPMLRPGHGPSSGNHNGPRHQDNCTGLSYPLPRYSGGGWGGGRLRGLLLVSGNLQRGMSGTPREFPPGTPRETRSRNTRMPRKNEGRKEPSFTQFDASQNNAPRKTLILAAPLLRTPNGTRRGNPQGNINLRHRLVHWLRRPRR